jgi:glycosyltransferase involved in cell wall biosynthesis
MENLELTILMPCLNEAETLATCIHKAKKFLSDENIRGEVLIADNGSMDGSQSIAENCGARVVHVSERGYGAALRSGIQNANGKYVIIGDADDSYDFLNLAAFITRLREGYQLVMGNRFLGGIKKNAMPFLNRYLGNPVLSFLGRIFFKSGIGDFHCGLRGFDREAMLKLNLRTDGMEFASEMVVKASLHDFKMAEVATTLSPDGRSRRPHLRPWRDGWRHLKLLLLLCPRWLFMYPGLLLISFGITLMALLMRGPLKIGKYYLDIHTMLFSSTFVIIGLQVLFFFTYSKLIASQITKSDRDIGFILKFYTLEKGIIFGLILTMLGFAGSFYTVFFWMQTAFGPLIPAQVMRILIPSVTCLIAGIQVIFSSFFISMLKTFFFEKA